MSSNLAKWDNLSYALCWFNDTPAVLELGHVDPPATVADCGLYIGDDALVVGLGS